MKSQTPIPEMRWKAQAAIPSPRLVFVNGAFDAGLSQLGELPDGVELRPLSQALAGDIRAAMQQHAGVFRTQAGMDEGVQKIAALREVATALARAERVLIITGAGLSADSGLPTYRGIGGLYNGRTADGLPIEAALSGSMLQRDPALCWKYLAELGGACLKAAPNAGHLAIAELQRLIPGGWVLTQNAAILNFLADSFPESGLGGDGSGQSASGRGDQCAQSGDADCRG